MGDLIRPHGWDARGESLWSILSKLSAENVMSGVELRRCFYIDKKATSFGRESIRSCLSLEGIDPATILANSNLSEKSLGWSIPTAFVAGTGHFSTKLRYCLNCLDEGFHSALFQVEAYTHCPWHDMRLRTDCPNCDASIDYEIGRAMADFPYRCHCESSLPTLRFDTGGVANSRAAIIKWTDAFVDQVKRIKSALRGTGSARLRLLTDGPIRHEQSLDLIRHVNGGRTRETYSRLHWTAARQRNATSTRYRIALLKPNPRDKELRSCRDAWGSDNSRDKAKFFNRVLLPSFNEAVSEALSIIRRQYLAKHAACWCMASPTSQYQFAMGLSCMWRAAFELWREKYDPIIGRPPTSEALESHWLIRDWISIANRYLIETERAWSRVRHPQVVMRLSKRLTVDALVRHYALLAMRLVNRIVHEREPMYLHGPGDLNQMIDTSYKPATYLLKLNSKRTAVTMFVDDDQVNLAKMAVLAADTDHDLSHFRKWPDGFE